MLWRANMKVFNPGSIVSRNCETVLRATAVRQPFLLWIDKVRFENQGVIFFKFLVRQMFPTGFFARLIDRLLIIAVRSFRSLDVSV